MIELPWNQQQLTFFNSGLEHKRFAKAKCKVRIPRPGLSMPVFAVSLAGWSELSDKSYRKIEEIGRNSG